LTVNALSVGFYFGGTLDVWRCLASEKGGYRVLSS
jgi:hypothetical protein